jgi:predicted DNA-binding protein
MKYQIYLDKETSEAINLMAEHDNKRPNTFIKELVEAMVRIAKATAEQTTKEVNHDGK